MPNMGTRKAAWPLKGWHSHAVVGVAMLQQRSPTWPREKQRANATPLYTFHCPRGTDRIALVLFIWNVQMATSDMKAPGKRVPLFFPLSVCLVTLMLGLSVAYERLNYHYYDIWQMPRLAAAVMVYAGDYGSLPGNLDELAATGLFGSTSYRRPRTGWENPPTGPAPHYLPIRKWDGKTKYVVAVDAGPFKDRRYVIVGDATVYFVTQEELQVILAQDDELRERTGQPGRWSSINWRR